MGTDASVRAGSASLRDVVPVWVVLGLAGALAWVVTVDRARSMGVGPGPMGLALPLFVGMWTTMMAAMMLPALGPAVAARASAAGQRWETTRVSGAIAFGAGFLLPWAAYGVLAFFALLGGERLVAAAPDAAGWLGVAILAVAGLYQLSPWKFRAVMHCRHPMNAGAREHLGARFAAGARDGVVCVGCCWALMTVFIAVGVMNLGATVALAAVIFAEKILPRPKLITGLVGAAFLVLAVIAAFDPSWLSGLHVPDMEMATEMGMEGM